MAMSSLLGPGGTALADITDHSTYINGVPYASFARIRSMGPVARIQEFDGGWHWGVFGHAEIGEVGRDWERFTTTEGIRLEEMDAESLHFRRTLMEHDPPAHTRLRRILQKGFTPRVVAGFEEAFRRLTGLVLEPALAKGRLDFAEEVARALPVRLLCRLLGVSDDDADTLVGWTDRLVSNTDPEFVVGEDSEGDWRLLPFRSRAALEVFRYAEDCARDRRANPGDDVVSQLLEATVEGEPLTDLEFKNFFTLLMVAGNETTRHAMNHAVTLLIDLPELLAPSTGVRLNQGGTDELLRAASVTMHFRRTATVATELGGRSIHSGDKVVMWYVAANVDPGVFVDPHRVQLERTPNPHYAFGVGPHLCLGASFARLELRVLVEELLKRVESVDLDGAVVRLRSNFHNGIKHLPIRVTTRSAPNE